MFSFSQKSNALLTTVDKRLQAIIHRAMGYQLLDFSIVEGIRTQERQEQLLKEGKTQTLQSKHLYGHALDIYPYVQGKGIITTANSPYWDILATIIKIASKEEGYPITWGGDWHNFVDKPHWELA